MIRHKAFSWRAWLALGSLMLVSPLATAEDGLTNTTTKVDKTFDQMLTEPAKLAEQTAERIAEPKELNPDDVFDRVLIEAEEMIVPTSLRRPDPCLPLCPPKYCPPSIVTPVPESDPAGSSETGKKPDSNGGASEIELPQRPDPEYTQPRPLPQANRTTFSGGPSGSALMASTSVPAMLGDFFGGSQNMPLYYPGQAELLPNQIQGAYVGFTNNGGFAEFVANPGNSTEIKFNSIKDITSINQDWEDQRNWINIIRVLQSSPILTGDIPGVNNIQLNVDNTTDGAKNFNLTIKNGNISISQKDGYVLSQGALAILVDRSIALPDYPPITSHTDGEATAMVNDFVTEDSDIFTLSIDSIFIPVEEAFIPSGAVAGRVKLSENSSPIPRDRIIMDYSLFNNVGLNQRGVSVNRFTPGFEKTFWGGDMSVELRVPFATTLDSDIGSGAGGITNQRAVEFGNATVHLKALLYNNDTFALSTGLGMAFPTADAITYNTANGVNVFKLSNDAVHMMPFVGFTSVPNDRWFHQGTLQVDAPVSGNATYFNTNPNSLDVAGPAGLRYAGDMKDPVFMYLDYNMGYWLIRENPLSGSDRRLTGLAAMFELHYNTTLNGFDAVSMGIPYTDDGNGNEIAMTFGDKGARFNQLTATIGTVIELGYDTSFSFGYGIPLSDQRMFDGEFRCNFTHLFGRSSVNSPQNPYGNMIRNRSL